MKKCILFLLTAGIVLSCSVVSKKEKLKARLTEIVAATDATVGVSIMDLATGDTLTLNGHKRFPMQSVYKFHLGMAVLSLVDYSMLSMDQKVFVSKKELLPDTHSPMRDDFPNGDTTLTLSTILNYTVSKGDNNGCDILFRLVGGPPFVNQYIHSLGIMNVSIRTTEEQMHQAWDAQYANWTTPFAMTEVLRIFSQQSHLSKNSTGFLWTAMVESPTGAQRLKSQLPPEATVAHKTGYSGVNDKGITAAVNDVGIVRMPDGRQYAIAVFVSDTKEPLEASEKIIADISKATWDYFNN